MTQGQYDHLRAQIRAADADIDDVRDRLAGVAQPFAAAHCVGEGLDAIEHGVDVGVDVHAIDHVRRAARGAQGGVQHGAAFGVVDARAQEHRIAPRFDAALARQLHQQFKRAPVEAIF